MKFFFICAFALVFFAPNAFTQSNSTSRLEEQRAPITTRAEEQFFLFELHECRKSGAIVECNLTVTNKGNDRRFNIWKNKIYLYDESGNRYRCSTLRFAEEIDPGTRTFVKGVSAKVRLTFSRTARDAAKAALLDIGFGSGNPYPKSTSVRFRGIFFR